MAEETKIASPCVDNCCLGDDDICLGCYRHLNEITEWGSASNTRRLEIIKRAKARAEQRAGNRPGDRKFFRLIRRTKY